MSCCGPVCEGGHGRNLCALGCFQEWVEKGGPQCPTCRKSWATEVSRGKWLERRVNLLRAFEQEEQFLQSRIDGAVRRSVTHLYTVEVREGEEEHEVTVTSEERDIALCPAVGDPTVMEELDVEAERSALRRRRSRALAHARREDERERSVEQMMLWSTPTVPHPPSALEVITAMYMSSRARFLVFGTQGTLDALILARNNLFVAQALGKELDSIESVAEYHAAKSQLLNLETPAQYPAAPGTGPLSFGHYLQQFCTDKTIE